MDQRLTIVTGGSRGIGRCLVQAFIVHGDVLNMSRLPATVDATAHGRLHNLSIDLADQDGTLAALAAWFEVHPQYRVHHLIHNGAALELGWIGELPAEATRRAFAVNAHTPVAITASLHERRRFGDGARVVYVVSSLGRHEPSLSFAGLGLYSASKAALGRLALVQARELELRGSSVTIVRVHPGIVSTDMQDQLRSSLELDPAFAEKTAGLPPYDPDAWTDIAPERDPRTISAELSAAFIEWVALHPDVDTKTEYDFYRASSFHQQRRAAAPAFR